MGTRLQFVWTEEQVSILLRLVEELDGGRFVEVMNTDAQKSHHYVQTGWNMILQKFLDVCGVQITREQLKSKWRRLCFESDKVHRKKKSLEELKKEHNVDSAVNHLDIAASHLAGETSHIGEASSRVDFSTRHVEAASSHIECATSRMEGTTKQTIDNEKDKATCRRMFDGDEVIVEITETEVGVDESNTVRTRTPKRRTKRIKVEKPADQTSLLQDSLNYIKKKAEFLEKEHQQKLKLEERVAEEKMRLEQKVAEVIIATEKQKQQHNQQLHNLKMELVKRLIDSNALD